MEELLSKKKGAGSVWFNLQVGYSQSIKEIKNICIKVYI